MEEGQTFLNKSYPHWFWSWAMGVDGCSSSDLFVYHLQTRGPSRVQGMSNVEFQMPLSLLFCEVFLLNLTPSSNIYDVSDVIAAIWVLAKWQPHQTMLGEVLGSSGWCQARAVLFLWSRCYHSRHQPAQRGRPSAQRRWHLRRNWPVSNQLI